MSTFHTRTVLKSLSLACLPIAAYATQLNIPDYPLFLTSSGVAPNILLTLDDSGSMSRAYTPDLCGASYLNCQSSTGAADYILALSNRPAKSAAFNGMYYSPNVVYSPPLDASGTPLATTPWTAARNNGFDTASSTVNLSTSYRPTAYYWLGSAANLPGAPYGGSYPTDYMSHYLSDVRCSSADRCQYLAANASWNNTGNGTDCDTNNFNEASDNAVCQTLGMQAYYYVFDAGNSNCNGTLEDNDCYDIVIVGSGSGPGTEDLNGDGVLDNADKDERQNFANWYSFYRTRNMATVSAASRAFATLPATVRVGWQALNTCRGGTSTSFAVNDCEGWQTTTTNFSNAIRPFTGTYKSNFYNWLQRLPSSGGTPLRGAFMRAGWYYTQSGDGNPYDNDFSASGSDQYSCRKNFHIAMTDGRWTYENIGTFGDQEPSTRPYGDNNSNAVADIAYYYWANDLMPNDATMPDNVPASYVDRSGNQTTQDNNAKNDPARWQHMVNFTVGLGLTGFFSELSPAMTWAGDTYSGSYLNLLAGTASWPLARADPNSGDTYYQGAPGNVADLWHAALNSRGRFYSADSPDALVTAFQDIVDTISSTTTSLGGGAGLSVSASIIRESGGSTILYQATFDQNWESSLKALDFQGADGSIGSTYWDAATLIPATGDRKIYTYNGSSKEAFATCGGSLETALDATDLDGNGNGDNQCEQLLNWLRSSWIPSSGAITSASWASNQITFTFASPGHGYVDGDVVTITGANPSGYNGTYTVDVTSATTFKVTKNTYPGAYVNGAASRYANLRNRVTTVLGDIVGSDLTYSKSEDFGYAVGSSAVAGGGTSGTYDDYVASTGSYASTGKKYRTPLVFAGANDGMLHAFRADTGNANSGKELFAYVPAGVYSHLGQLADDGYAHKFYVNGQITVGDIYSGSSTGWRTYLVGGLGQGGKTIYALDVSDPEGFNASSILWEYNRGGTDADMGFSFGKAKIAPLNNGQWAVIFGNGYNSSNERAYLYVVNAADGSVIAKLATDNTITSNGLSTPYLYDSDGDQLVDVAYAGDLQGNLWRFDLKSSGWTTLSGRKLFTARNADNQIQSITAPPVVSSHPVRGVLVYVGTGSYISANDLTDTTRQSFYGIWDDPNNTSTVSRSSLLAQQITEEVSNAGASWRVTSDNAIDWDTQRGWYIDMPASVDGAPSERIVNTALVIDANSGTGYTTAAGQLYWRVIFTTVINYSDPCLQGGTGWIMELDLHDGSRPRTAVLDYNNDRAFDNSDWRGATDSDGDGTISDAERIASGGVPVTGKKLGDDGIPGNTTLVDYCPSGESCVQYKETAMSTGTPHQTLQDRPDDNPTTPPGPGGPATRIYWQQIL